MKKQLYILLLSIVIIGIIAGITFQFNGADDTKQRDGMAFAATVFKSPSCGCCHVYAEYLKHEGVTVEIHDVADLTPVKQQYGIPPQLQSCHTSVIEGYAVEGHIPLEIVEKLLEEKPDIKGIALPGMPSGSPGMPGVKMGSWTIYALAHDGSISEFMKY